MIARPFALAGFSFVFGLLVLNLAEGATVVVAAAAIGCILPALFVKELPDRAVYIVAALSIVASCVSFEGSERFDYNSALGLADDNTEICAVVTDIQVESDGTYYILDSVKIGEAEAEYKLRMRSEEQLNVGDKIEFAGEVKSVGQNKESHRYYKSKGIYLYCRADGEISILDSGERPLSELLYRARKFVSASLMSLVGGDEGSLAAGMLTGDKSLMSGSVINAFKACGLSHVLAVSGLHMNIIVLALYKLLGRISKRTKRLSALLCIPIAVGYAAFSGFSVSAVRACVMVCIMLVGKLFSRKGDPLNSLGLAALIITLFNPYAVLDWSFMLSFSATLGIVLSLPAISRADDFIYKKFRRKFIPDILTGISDAALVSAAATLFTLPVMILFVGSFSLLFLPANLATFAAVPVLMISAVITAALNLFPFSLPAQITATVCRIVGRYMLLVTDGLSDFSFATVKVDLVVMKIWLAVTLAVVAFTVFFIADRKRAGAFCILFTVGSLTVTSLVFAFVNAGSIKVTAVNVGDSACFIVSRGTSAVLIGCEGEEYIADGVLNELGITDIELAVVRRGADYRDLCIDGIYSRYSHGKTVAAADCETENLPSDTVKTDSFSFDFHSSEIRYENENGYERCVVSDKYGSVMFVFGTDTPEFNEAKTDFLFSLAQPPEWIDTRDYKAVIVSAGGNTAVSGGNVYSTYDNSNLTLDFNRWGKFKINAF